MGAKVGHDRGIELDKSPIDVPSSSFPLVDFLLLLLKSMGWGWRVRKTVLQSIYHKGSSILTFIFLRYFYFIGISLAQSKFNWLVASDMPDYSSSCMVSSGSILSLGTTRKSREKLEKVNYSPSLVKRFPLEYQKSALQSTGEYITDYNNLLDTGNYSFHWVSLGNIILLRPMNAFCTFICKDCGKCFVITKEILLVLSIIYR